MWNWDWLVCSERGSLSDLFGFKFGRLGHLESGAFSFQKKSLGFLSGLFYRLKTSTNFNTNIFLARCLFFWADCRPSVLEAPLEKKPTSLHRQASKAAKPEPKVCSGIDFHIKTNLRTGKIGQILPFFFLDFGLDFSHSKKRSH